MAGAVGATASLPPHVETGHLPGVDTILRVAGLKPDYTRADPVILERARLRGIAVHEACAALDDDDLDWDAIHPPWVGYVRAWEKFVKDTGFVVLANEFHVVHPTLGYQGRPDVYGRLDGAATMVDRKAVRKFSPTYAVQLAAYTMPGIQEERPASPMMPAALVPLGHGPWRRIAVQLKADGKYRREEYTDPEDYEAFRDALAAYRSHAAMDRWREKYGLSSELAE